MGCVSKINLVFLLVIFSTIGCSKHKDDSYEILSPWIVQKTATNLAFTNLVYYILKQTHEPLFRKDDGENYTTKVLEKWSRNLSSSQFLFCPDTTREFNNGLKFDRNFFLNYITETTKKFDKNFTIEGKGDCVKVTFEKAQKRYLDFLTFYENAPTVKRTENIEDGLGEFYVDEMKEERIILKRKKNIRKGYNKIVIRKLTENQNMSTQNIEDFNLINSADIPEEIRKKYRKVDTLDLKSIILVINHPNREIRQSLYNCIEINKLLESFFYNKKFKFHQIDSVLPIGISGAQLGAPAQVCQVNKNRFKNKEIVFGNWFSEINNDAMEKFSRDFYDKTGIKIKIKKITVQELISRTKPKSYNLTIIALDATRDDPIAFFEIFGDTNKSEYNFRISELETIYNQLLYSQDNQERLELTKRGVKLVRNKYLALPLCQTTKTLYYPPEIKNIVVGRGFLQYPEVAEFRL